MNVYIVQFEIEDYICRENSRQTTIIDYLFSMNYHRSIFLLLDTCHKNGRMEMYIEAEK